MAREKHQWISDQALRGVREVDVGHDAVFRQLVHHPEDAVNLDTGGAGAAAKLLVACQKDAIRSRLGQHKTETVIG
jgi:hypothetical protein